MIASEPTTPGQPDPGEATPTGPATPTGSATPTGTADQPVATLRGAGVNADARRVGMVVVAACLLALAGVTIGLFVAGASKNAQITSLRTHGVPVEVTVTKCHGLLGGSGSNAAGYACRGTFEIGGHRYDEAIPGYGLLPPGATIRGVAVPGNPPLFTTAGAAAAEHPSWKVFVVPTVLLVVLVLLLGAVALRVRHVRQPG